MKKLYTKPEVVITSFDAETSIMQISSVNAAQSTFKSVGYSSIKTGTLN
jgi:hypothetical protein